jgi:hypothetical protein
VLDQRGHPRWASIMLSCPSLEGPSACSS